MKDGYCEKINVEVPSEEYSFKVGYIYGDESFIVGNKTKVILHPRLYLQADEEMKINLKLLKEVKISVELLNNQNIKSTLEFDNIQFSNNEDYVL